MEMTVTAATTAVTAAKAVAHRPVRVMGRASSGIAVPRATSAEMAEAATMATMTMTICDRFDDHCAHASAGVGSGSAETSMGSGAPPEPPPTRPPRISGR
ncbi:hypothetical protein CJ204_02085 [Corynebacterium xerosis]|uniref:Uncharacterized protein n=1 Tax=Corynebacterium xerosis TaxID=1725 RepID=A0A2N6T149_9CORY|nr:hypothetical protein CJ204_02085 [Corynebacterium xerosis]